MALKAESTAQGRSRGGGPQQGGAGSLTASHSNRGYACCPQKVIDQAEHPVALASNACAWNAFLMISRGTRAGGKLPTINVHGLCTCTSDRTTPAASEGPDGGTILHALITTLLGRRRVLRWPSKGASTSREASPRLQAAITHGLLMWQVAATCARRHGRGRTVYRNRKESVGICSVSSCAHGLALACLLSVPGSK